MKFLRYFVIAVFLCGLCACSTTKPEEKKPKTIDFVMASAAIAENETITEKNVCKATVTIQKNSTVKMGIPWVQLERITGKKVRRAIEKDELLNWKDVELSDQQKEEFQVKDKNASISSQKVKNMRSLHPQKR